MITLYKLCTKKVSILLNLKKSNSIYYSKKRFISTLENKELYPYKITPYTTMNFMEIIPDYKNKGLLLARDTLFKVNAAGIYIKQNILSLNKYLPLNKNSYWLTTSTSPTGVISDEETYINYVYEETKRLFAKTFNDYDVNLLHVKNKKDKKNSNAIEYQKIIYTDLTNELLCQVFAHLIYIQNKFVIEGLEPFTKEQIISFDIVVIYASYQSYKKKYYLDIHLKFAKKFFINNQDYDGFGFVFSGIPKNK